jgi:dTDP-glucose 4,6-dehydratase
MNLLVTGGCGFIGSNFINYYFDVNQDCRIINIDVLYYCANINNIRKDILNSDRYKFIKGNICSYDLMMHILEEYKITHVIHFAAQSHVDNSFHTPLQYTQDNIVGTHTLLEASRKYNILKLFIHVSTDEVYGESMISNDEKKKTEETILCPTNPYASTKAGAELIVMSYYHSYKMPIIITRGNNVYGPNQYPEKLIPRCIKLLKENKKLTIHGDGSNLRSFIHTDDVASAFEIILERGKIGEIYNIGGNEDNEYSVMEVAKKIIKNIKNTDKYQEWMEYVEDRVFNDKRYYISNQKLKDLGWNIKKNFNESLYELCE